MTPKATRSGFAVIARSSATLRRSSGQAWRSRGARGFTLIELLTALVILSLLGVMSYRGLSAVVDSREHVTREAQKWRALGAFFSRLERDVQRAAPGPVRGTVPALRGNPRAIEGALVELTRMGTDDRAEPPRRIAYALNAGHEVELWLWPAIDTPAQVEPERYPVLTGVRQLELAYLASDLTWLDAWPSPRSARSLPLALRVRVVLATGEEIVRVFTLT